MSLIGAVAMLVDELRVMGIPVTTSEVTDALAGLRSTGLSDREEFRDCLAATLVKSSAHESAFNLAFDIFFARPQADADGNGQARSRTLKDLTDEELRQRLVAEMSATGQVTLLLRLLADEFVERYAGIVPGRAVAGRLYQYRVERAINSGGLLDAVVGRASANASDVPQNANARRAAVEEVELRIQAFRLEVESQVRQRLVADRGASDVARTLRRPLPEDADFLTASAPQLRELQEVLPPLAAAIGARLENRFRTRHSSLIDMRRTLRSSLSYGGLPMAIAMRPPRPPKPNLVVLADISGSVATFAAYTLQLTMALRAHFARVRSFVFIDGLDEVTNVVEQASSVLDVTSTINERGLGVWLDGRSDYGNALGTFAREHIETLTMRTTVLVLGDARTNYHAPRADALALIARSCDQVLWLNPESAAAWDSGDSVMATYAPHCTAVAECRTARQLREFIEALV